MVLGANESGDGRGGFVNLFFRDGASLRAGLGDTVREVVVQQRQRNRLKGFCCRGNLGEDVDAVGVLLDHPLDAAHLALSSPKPLQDRFFVVDVTNHSDPLHPASLQKCGQRLLQTSINRYPTGVYVSR